MARRESIDSRRAMLMCEGALRLRGEEVGEHSRGPGPAGPIPGTQRASAALSDDSAGKRNAENRRPDSSF